MHVYILEKKYTCIYVQVCKNTNNENLLCLIVSFQTIQYETKLQNFGNIIENRLYGDGDREGGGSIEGLRSDDLVLIGGLALVEGD